MFAAKGLQVLLLQLFNSISTCRHILPHIVATSCYVHLEDSQFFVVPVVPRISVSRRTAGQLAILRKVTHCEQSVSYPDLASRCTAASPSESPWLFRTKLCCTRRTTQIQRHSTNTKTQIPTQVQHHSISICTIFANLSQSQGDTSANSELLTQVRSEQCLQISASSCCQTVFSLLSTKARMWLKVQKNESANRIRKECKSA